MKNDGWPKDIHGYELRDGDIVEEGKIGEVIWDNSAKITKRPIGIFKVFHKTNTISEFTPERTDFYNVVSIREGEYEFLDAECAKRYHSDPNNMKGELYLCCYDGKFQAWDNIEIIGNVHDDFE